MWVGALTALFAATIAVAQNDIKKVLAYSTISQLGFMVAAVGMGAFVAGMFHLTTHAFFKALLFLGAGSVILGMEGARDISTDHKGPDEGHAHIDPQDMTGMGGLRNKMPATFWVYLIGALALAGIAPLAGFFSKDEILAAAGKTNIGLFLVLLASAFLTAFYMGRQLWLVFFGKPRSQNAGHARENVPVIVLPLVILAILSVLGGLLNFPGNLAMEHWLEHTLGKGLEAPFSPPVAILSFGIALAGLAAAWVVYGRNPSTAGKPDPLANMLGAVYSGARNKWWVDEFYQSIIIKPYRAVSVILAEPVDQGLIDGIAIGLGALTRTISQYFRKMENGYVRSYAFSVVLGIVLIFTYLVLR
jgi:NADH-quinone oxidoreductase subunit L